MNASIRTLLSEVARRIKEAGDLTFAQYVDVELEKDDAAIEAFLRSNEMWGGSGSVADSAGANSDRSMRRKIEESLIALGEAQLREGITNVRTESWVDAFRLWKASGI